MNNNTVLNILIENKKLENMQDKLPIEDKEKMYSSFDELLKDTLPFTNKLLFIEKKLKESKTFRNQIKDMFKRFLVIDTSDKELLSSLTKTQIQELNEYYSTLFSEKFVEKLRLNKTNGLNIIHLMVLISVPSPKTIEEQFIKGKELVHTLIDCFQKPTDDIKLLKKDGTRMMEMYYFLRYSICTIDEIERLEKEKVEKEEAEKYKKMLENGEIAVIEDCPICYDQITSNQEYIKTSCKHLFHKSCIGMAFSLTKIIDNLGKKVYECPYCRTPQLASLYNKINGITVSCGISGCENKCDTLQTLITDFNNKISYLGNTMIDKNKQLTAILSYINSFKQNTINMIDILPICTDHKLKLSEISNNTLGIGIGSINYKCPVKLTTGKKKGCCCEKYTYQLFSTYNKSTTKVRRTSTRTYNELGNANIPSSKKEICEMILNNPSLKYFGLCNVHNEKLTKNLKEKYDTFVEYVSDYNKLVEVANSEKTVEKKKTVKQTPVVIQVGDDGQQLPGKCTSQTKSGTLCKNNKCAGHEVCYTHMTAEQKTAYTNSKISN